MDSEQRVRICPIQGVRICPIVGTGICLPCLPLNTAVKSLQLQKYQSVEVSFNVHCPTRYVNSAQYTVSSVHSCNKRAHITQNMYIHGSHTRLTRFTYTALICTRVTCAILFEVAQVQADLMLGRGSKVGRLGAGGLRGITPTNHLRMHTREKSNKCKQCDSRYLFSGILGHI